MQQPAAIPEPSALPDEPKITPELVAEHGLTPDEHARILELIGREPDPEVVARVGEECQRLLGLLTDPTLRLIAVRKLEGFTNEEIAAELGVVCRSVERKLNLIRQRWAAEAGT